MLYIKRYFIYIKCYIYKRSQIKICINFKTSDQGSGREVRGILQFSKTEKLVEKKRAPISRKQMLNRSCISTTNKTLITGFPSK